MACASLVYDTAPSNSFAGMELCAQILLLAERFLFAHKSRFLFAHKVFCLHTNRIAHKSCFWQSVFCFSVSDDSVPSYRDGELRASKSKRERAGACWRGARMMAARRKEWQLPSALAPSCACSLLLSAALSPCSLLLSAAFCSCALILILSELSHDTPSESVSPLLVPRTLEIAVNKYPFHP